MSIGSALRAGRTAIAALAALGFHSPAPAQETELSDSEIVARSEDVIARVMSFPGAVGLSVAVGRGDRVLLEGGYGIADVELDVPVNSETLFRIGSVTKQFTAAAIMKLVEQGKLGLDDDLRDYVAAFDTGGRAITIRQLLNHVSGVPNYTNQPGFYAVGSPRDLTHEELLDFVDGIPFDFEPGQGWAYSNTGYYLLGMVIEAAGSRPYAEFLQQEFFDPLRLTRTRYGSEREIIRNRAQGYELDRVTGTLFNDRLISMNTPGAAGALSASAGDLIRWQIALSEGRAVSPASYEAMVTSSVATSQGTARYGFGLRIDDVGDGKRRISHGGGIPGFNSVLIRLPDDGNLHVAVISNSSLPSEVVAAQILAAIAPQEPRAPTRTTPQPGAEEAVTRLVEALARGEPIDAVVDDRIAESTRRFLPGMQRQLVALGPVESVTFEEVEESGADVFNVDLASGQVAVLIVLDADGRTTLVAMRPEGAPPGVAPMR